MAREYKTGRWSKKENQFIQDNAQELTVEQISKRLNRAPESVKEKINATGLHLRGTEAYAYDAEKDLRNSQHWRELQDQLSPEELTFFLAEWKNIISQFRDDVLPTEKLQVMDLIKVEILMNRCLKQQKKTEEELKVQRELLEDEKKKDAQDRDKAHIAQINAMLASLMGATDSLTKTFRELLKQKETLFQKLKATREQRIEKLESSKETAAGWLRKMLTGDARIAVGKRIEKLRLATEVEVIRLSELHTYEDGSVDRPLLTPEAVLMEDEEE